MSTHDDEYEVDFSGDVRGALDLLGVILECGVVPAGAELAEAGCVLARARAAARRLTVSGGPGSSARRDSTCNSGGRRIGMAVARGLAELEA